MGGSDWCWGQAGGSYGESARNPTRQELGAKGHLGQRLRKMFNRIPEEHADVVPDRAGETPTRWVALVVYKFHLCFILSWGWSLCQPWMFLGVSIVHSFLSWIVFHGINMVYSVSSNIYYKDFSFSIGILVENQLTIYRSVYWSTILFNWFICISLCQYPSVLITAAL